MLSQSHRLIAISTPLGEDELVFYKGTLYEALGETFSYTVELLSEDDSIALENLLGQNVTIRMETDDETRYFNGFITEFQQLENTNGLSHYKAVIKPWLWLLNLSENCRIFQEKNVPDVIKQVFEELGFSDFEMQLNNTYKPVEYIVQFNESDFNFVSRLMQELGIYYYFKHINGKHTLVLVDQSAALPDLKTIAYQTPEDNDGKINEDVISQWGNYKQVRTSAVRLTDYDFEVPSKNLEAVSSVPTTSTLSAIEKFNYPGKYKERNNGSDYTRLLMERENALYEKKSGLSYRRDLFAGAHFTLEDHFRADQNKEYLLTQVNLTLESQAYLTAQQSTSEITCKITFKAIPASAEFRSQANAIKPRMRGPQTAIVVGKKGEEIWTDKFGRIKVAFHWDRQTQKDEKSSCWIRVSQSWAGKNWGSIQIPRVGQEVLIDFLNGDPDQPIVIGSVYNGSSLPPYPLPANASQSGLKSRTTKGGGAFNEIKLDDKKGKEKISLFGSKDLTLESTENSHFTSGKDHHSIVKGINHELVEKDSHHLVKGKQISQIDKDTEYTVKGKYSGKIDGDAGITYSKSFSMAVGKDTSWKDGANFNHKVGQKYSLGSGTDIHLKAGTGFAVQAGTTVHIKSGASLVLEASAQVSLKVGGSFISINPAGVQIKGPMVMINSGGAAGSGSGSSPTAPSAPAKPSAPEEAQAADDAGKGGKDDANKADKPAEGKKLKLNEQKASDYQAPTHASAPAATTVAAAAATPTAENKAKEEEEVTCEIESFSAKCGHGRSIDEAIRIIEIVPKATKSSSDSDGLAFTGNNKATTTYTVKKEFGGEEKITAELKIKNDCTSGKVQLSEHGDWQQGNKQSYNIKAIAVKDTKALANTSPTNYTLAAACEHGYGQSIQVNLYPSEQITAEVSLEYLTAAMDKVNDAWEDWGKHIFSILPITLNPKILPPKGKLSYSKGWKEAKDWRAYYATCYKASLEPIIGIEIELQLSILELVSSAAGVPPVISRIGSKYLVDILFLLGAGVQLQCSGQTETQYYSTGDVISEGQLKLGVQGKIWIGLMAKVGSEAFLSASVKGKCELAPYGGGLMTAERSGLFVEPEIKVPAPTLSVTFEARAFKIYTKKKTKEWKPWTSEYSIKANRYQIV